MIHGIATQIEPHRSDAAPSRVGRFTTGLVVVSAIVVLHLLGTGPLSPPPVRSVDDLEVWLRSRDAVTVAFVVVRLVALAVAYHLVMTSALGLLGRVLRSARLVELAEAWTLPGLRGPVRRIVGLGLSASLALGTPLPQANARTATEAVAPMVGSSGTATLRSAGDLVVVVAEPTHPGSGTATLRLVTPAPDPGTATMRSAGPRDSASSPGSPGAVAPAEAALTDHVVVVGDHLWALAATAVSHELDRPADDAEVARYWRRVLSANPQFADPDLIHPGDVVHLPADPLA